MSFCLNLDCQSPQNLEDAEVCESCGATLLLKHRYRAIAEIGQGGFGRTFLAIDEDKPSKPRCVIKQLLPSAQGTRYQKKAADLFEQEAMRLEELGTHPQIPALLAHFSQDQHQYLVQEFIEGKNLAEVLESQGAFTEGQVRSVLRSLLPVLEFIHARNVIHRDVKPANIIALASSQILGATSQANSPDWIGLLQALSRETAYGFRDFAGHSYRFGTFLSDRLAQLPPQLAIGDYQRCQQMATQFASYARLGFSQRQYLVADASRLLYEMRHKYEPIEPVPAKQLVLVDFGAAKSTQGSASRTGTAIGSPGFTAPEQAHGKAEFASDLYSLGVTCIHLLTQTSPLDLFDSHENAWIWPAYLVNPVSDRLMRVLNKLIEPGINHRYQSATDVLRDLESRVAQTAKLAVKLAISAPPSLPNPPAPDLPAVLPPVSPPARRRGQPNWQCVRTLRNPGKLYAIALSPKQPILASSSGTTIRLWDVQTGQPIRTLTGHLDIIASLAISPDGSLLISGSADKTLKFWELPTGKRLASLTSHTDTVLAVAIAPDGKTLASSSFYDPIVLWDLETGREHDRFYAHTSRIDGLAFSPDGKRLVSGSGDTTLRLWDWVAAKERPLVGHTDRITDLAFSPDGKTLASASWDGSVKLWSLSTRRQKRSLAVSTGHVNAVAFSPDGKLLLTGGETLQLWSPRTGKPVGTLAEHASAIQAIVTSPVHTSPIPTMVTASVDGQICIWQAL